ncbi:MAG TPA: cell division protein ZapD [Steroidobacteraceae bacterium]|jgi:cell division protein ZapD|nr:cell division protein ZapD [Steroidobacteraceae bacterium]
MQSAAPETEISAEPATETAMLVFEQPLNERMRTFLRLDFLYNQALHHNEMASPWGSRAAMSSLIDILAMTTRGDVRSDVLKELETHLATLNEFQSRPGVDTQRLKTLTSNLQRLRSDLMSAGSAFLQPLRDSEFLSAIKHRSAIPGGTCEFDLPDYYFWLAQPDELRMRSFNQWLGLLRPMCDAIAELLWLTRQNGRTRRETAVGGTFTITFERDNPLQLLRISLAASAALYPEISGSHHRCSVRFLAWNGITVRPTQTEHDVPFMLSCCA